MFRINLWLKLCHINILFSSFSTWSRNLSVNPETCKQITGYEKMLLQSINKWTIGDKRDKIRNQEYVVTLQKSTVAVRCGIRNYVTYARKFNLLRARKWRGGRNKWPVGIPKGTETRWEQRYGSNEESFSEDDQSRDQ